MFSVEICLSCEGDGLVEKAFFPDIAKSVRRYERLRCETCNGMGVTNASEQAELHSPL